MARHLNEGEINDLLELIEQQLDILGYKDYCLSYCNDYPERSGTEEYGVQVVIVQRVFPGHRVVPYEPIPLDDVDDNGIIETVIGEILG